MVPSQRLEYLGLVLDSSEASFFLPKEELQTLQSAVQRFATQEWSSLRLCKRILGPMVASFEAFLYAQFHTRVLQKEILSRWDKLPSSLDYQIWVSRLVRSSLVWWLTSPVLRTRK